MYNSDGPFQGLLPPHDTQAELDLLGELLCHPASIPVARGQLGAEDFYGPSNRRMFEALCACEEQLNAPLDPEDADLARRARDKFGFDVYPLAIVRAWIDDHGGLGPDAPRKADGVLAALASLAYERTTTWRGLSEICKRIRDKARLRACLETLQKAQGELYDSNGPHDAQAFFERLCDAVNGHRYDGAQVSYRRIGESHVAALAEGSITAVEGLRGISTGLEELDRLTGGWQRGDVTMVSGPPGGGKTAFILDQCARICTTPDPDGVQRDVSALFSMEMPAERVHLRARCREGMVNLKNAVKARNDPTALTHDERRALKIAREAMADWPWVVDDRKELTVEAIRGALYQLKREIEDRGQRLALVGIDYFQLLGGNARAGRNPTRERELNLNGLDLVKLAEELRVPILLAVQLTEDQTAVAECKAMRRHAQGWLHLKIGDAIDGADPNTPRHLDIVARKGRDTGTGRAGVYFTGAFQRFTTEPYD